MRAVRCSGRVGGVCSWGVSAWEGIYTPKTQRQTPPPEPEADTPHLDRILATRLWKRYLCIITACKRSLGQGNIFRSMCQEGTPGAGTAPGPWTRYTPQAGTPREQVNPQDQVHHPGTRYTPRVQCMLGDTGNKRVVRILLECILVIVADGNYAKY